MDLSTRFEVESMKEKISFRMEEWFQKDLKTFMEIHHCTTTTEAIHQIFKKYLELSNTSQDSLFKCSRSCLQHCNTFYCSNFGGALNKKELPCLESLTMLRKCPFKECQTKILKSLKNETSIPF